jgi:hypothetical protein
MKRFAIGLLVVAMFISAASAELLVTANPLGQGKWGVLGSYLADSNLQGFGLTNLSASTIGGYVGYGVMDKLDLYVQAGSMTVGNLPAGNTSTGTGYGLSAKYAIMDETANMPAVALGVGYKLLTSTTNGTATGGNQIVAGIGVSKMMVPFIPYAGLTYRGTNYNGFTTGVQTDLTVGTAIAWSKQGAVLVEYTSQMVDPNGAANYTAGQIAAGVAYLL